MNDFLHIHLPCTDADIKLLEKALGIEFQRPIAETIPSKKVKICPLSSPTGKIGFINIKYE